VYAKFLQDVFCVASGGVLGYRELLCNLTVALPLGEKICHNGFSPRQLIGGLNGVAAWQIGKTPFYSD
jgi:hypothetical protein